MGIIRTVGIVAAPATTGWRTPVYTGAVTAAVSFSITNNIATIVLGAGNLPTNGYNRQQQVTLWGFTTATYFNGKTVTVLDNNPADGSFRFYFNNANVGSTADTGNTAPSPVERFRSVRIECSQGNLTNIVYVGDLNVTATQYSAALTLAGQLAYEIAGENIDASRICIFGSSATNCGVQVSLIM